ncbi:hypothetical protein MSG28_000789 [Choristoneura fumiferana]|uniref:Uncharacterized protein n=1 Tax=Choristoneura fumiferana TaxID=7141 RepID=A0ACC0K316_CHOFU|nr:hypothetical protein MSG28_000789 [Choristoneura fumiferana]
MELFLILFFVPFGLAYDKASFYGASYITYPLQEAKGITDISFRFRTHLSDALLLLAAGKTDYCMVDEAVVKKRLPGRFFELNIHFGVFLGGQGDFSELFLGHMENFRGCMEDVFYNGVKIIEKARSRSASVRVEGVTWNCAPEFDADLNSDISFIDEGAYLILPKISSRAGGSWTSGPPSVAKTIQTKVFEWDLRGAVRVLMSNDIVAASGPDILAALSSFSGSAAGLDGIPPIHLKELTSAAAGDNGERLLGHLARLCNFMLKDLQSPLNIWYLDDGTLGGMPEDVQEDLVMLLPHFVNWGWKLIPGSANSSPAVLRLGCIKPVEVDDKIFGLPNSVVTYALYPLTVLEGGVAVITTQNIDVVLDHHKYGVRPSGVLLHLAQSPQHGRIAIDLSPQRNSPQFSNYLEGDGKMKQYFTLMNLSRDKVKYVHDGSENHQDAIVLDMELIPETKFTLPSYLQGRNTFVLHVNVTPVNDPPVLNLLPGKVLRLTQGTRKIITSDILKAEDPDTPPEDLLYTVLHGKNEIQSGHIEMSGQPVDSFTQQDIDTGVISYVHGSNSDKQLNKTSLKLTLQVSDGIETSGPAILRITIVPLQVRLVNNTGLQLVHNSYAIITADNLTFATNADETNVQVKYDIVKPPHFGVIERLRVLDGTWQTVDSFTSEMVTFRRVRYMHLVGNPLHDEFKFKASVGTIRTNTLYDFRLTFIKLELYQSINEELVLNNTREAFISAQHLRFKTKPIGLPSDRILYTIIKTPKYGILHLSSGKYHLQTHSTFTQQNIDTDQLWYRLHRRAYSHIQDEFSFVVGATECENITGVMTIRHTPAYSSSDHSPGRVHTTLERLQVMEGSRMVIPTTHLNFRIDVVTNLVFNITHLPRHGKIEVISESLKIVRDNTTYFTLKELNSDRVYYSHDDSESRHDSFHFMALSPEPEDFQYVGVFHIDIILKNDNSPVRATDKIFHIVHGGARLITFRDLSYTDADLDTKPSDIIYTIQRYTKDPPNGGIYRADNPTEQIAQFTQDDINKNLVLFKHQGKEYGKMAFWISDGLFDVNGNLEIQASPPFIRMYSTNGSIVENGKAVVITTRDMQVDTNMNCLEEDIRYEVIQEPKHGAIEVGEGQGAFTFTQLDVAAGRVAYRHREPKTPSDQFRFKVMCLEAWGEGVYPIKIFPSSYWEPLKVMHPQIEPSNIVFKVTEGPYHGWLEITSTPGTIEVENLNEEPAHAKVFDQSIINVNRLVYMQSGVNRTRDKIVMDVTNGIVWLRDVELHIIIIPEHFYITVSNLTVVEGEAVSVKPDLFRTVTEYYRGKVVAYKVIEKPKNGKIVMGDQELSLLPVLKLNSGNIQYVNDGSEESSDYFKLIAVTENGKESEPFFVRVNIVPVNDETPIVAANTGLAPALGRLIMLSGDSHHRSIKQFTQEDINNTLVYYEHTHPFSDLYTNDSFLFTVEAALANPIPDQIFNIDISVSSGGLAKYVHIPHIKVQEGDKVPIKVNVTNVIAYLETQAGLRQPQVEAQWSQPTHGVLQPSVSSLTQTQLESGVVHYEHDDSDTISDKIDMALYLLPDYVLLCNVTIPIHIIPVNDQPFRLLTDSPQIQVVQGENYTISKKDLITEDADTSPSDILYDIISGPTQGRIVMMDKNLSIDDAQSINKFTQDDINNGRVIYEHSGMLQTATFYFRVWDGQFKPTYTIFTIDVLPVSLNASSMHPVYLQQGSNVATVTTEQIYIETNAKKNKVWYNITRQPVHGRIYVGRNLVTYFSHRDLIDKVVIYMQNDMTVANDSFDLIAYVHNSNSTHPFTIDVFVQPLMVLEDLRVESDKTKITLSHMDATGLAKLSGSNPIYTILRKPRFGTIKNIIRSSGGKTSAREREVPYFSHEDVKAGVIYYVTRKSSSKLNGLEDGFKFLLTASIFQPAAGDVRILIGNKSKKNLPGPNDPESHEGVPVANGDSASYYLTILMALSGIVLAIIVILGLVKCRRCLARDRNALVKIHGQSQGAVAPIPLPRPPDHLMPSPAQPTPPIKRYVSSDQSVHTGASTPLPSGGSVACKVTPLADAGLPDLNARYPYGTDDHTDAEDWSSYEASETAYPIRAPGVAPSNPMLRRNQYWV